LEPLAKVNGYSSVTRWIRESAGAMITAYLEDEQNAFEDTMERIDDRTN
jgi:hypothetical protein